MFNAAVPGFCTATTFAVLAVPTFWVAKVIADEEKDISGVGGTTLNSIALEVPPPGDGLLTVMEAFPLDERFAAGTVAVSTVLDVNVLCSGTPFQLTLEDSVNPAPFNVS